MMKIGELARETGVSPYTIRYYEKIGLIDAAKKDANGHRRYNKHELDLVNWVVCLKKSGMPLEKIKSYVTAFKTDTHPVMIDMLQVHRQNLLKQQSDLRHFLEVTERKLSLLEGKI